MKHVIYNNCKALIVEQARENKRLSPRDKAYNREVLNNLLDDLCRQLDFHCMRGVISEGIKSIYVVWLTNLVIRLH